MPDTFQLASEADDAQIDAVYRAAFADEPGGPNEEFLAVQLATHRGREGFSLVGAVHDGELVAFVYGYTGQLGSGGATMWRPTHRLRWSTSGSAATSRWSSWRCCPRHALAGSQRP